MENKRLTWLKGSGIQTSSNKKEHLWARSKTTNGGPYTMCLNMLVINQVANLNTIYSPFYLDTYTIITTQKV